MKLIDKYLPFWHYAKSNQIQLDVTEIPDVSITNQIDFSKSGLIKILFFLRGLSTKNLNLDNALRAGFILLEQNHNEIVLGLIAQPWKFNGNILKIDPENYSRFDQSDFIKAAWNFRYENEPAGLMVTTETRIHCTSKSALRKFSFYWLFIGFFSGVIRKEMLKIIKDEISKNE